MVELLQELGHDARRFLEDLSERLAEAAEQWLTGRMDDEAAIADLSGRFAVLVDAWRAARQRVVSPPVLQEAV
jgi:hypothetical protein